MKLAREDPEQAGLDFLWNFPETMCGKSSNPDSLELPLPREQFRLRLPLGPKEPFLLHLAVLLATAGPAASQKAIQGAAHFSEMLCGGALAAPTLQRRGQLHSLWRVGGKASQLHTLWPAANGKRPSLLCLSLWQSCLSWSSCSPRPVITGLLEAPVRPLFWEDHSVQGDGEKTRKNKH